MSIIEVAKLLKCLCLHAFGLEVRIQDSTAQGLHVRCNRAQLALRLQAYALALEYPDDRVGIEPDPAIKYDKGKYMVAFSLASEIQRLKKDTEFILFTAAQIDAPPGCLALLPMFVAEEPDILNLAEVRATTQRAMFSFARRLIWPVSHSFTSEAAEAAAAAEDEQFLDRHFDDGVGSSGAPTPAPSPTGRWSNSNSPSLRCNLNRGTMAAPLRRHHSSTSIGSHSIGSQGSSSTISDVMVPASLDNYNMGSQGSQEGKFGAHPWSREVFDALKFYARDLMKALGVTRGLSAAAIKALRRVWATLQDEARGQVLTTRTELSSDKKAALTSLVSELLERKLRELCGETFEGASALLDALGHSDTCTLAGMMQHAQVQVYGLDDRYARARTGSVSESTARAARAAEVRAARAAEVRRSSRKRKRPVSGTGAEFVEAEFVEAEAVEDHSGSGSEGDSDSDEAVEAAEDPNGVVWESCAQSGGDSD